MNNKINKDENNEFCPQNLPKRNEEPLADFSIKKFLFCLNPR